MSELLTTPLDYADVDQWSLIGLKREVVNMAQEQKTALPRRHGELERNINHALFEIACQNLDMQRYEGEMVETQIAV